MHHDDIPSRTAGAPSRPRSRGRRVAAGAATAIILGVLTGAPSVGATEVIGDDERDVFIGSGSLILPEAIARPGRESAAACPGCQWKATLTCDPVSPTACRGAARLCPNDHQWLKISLLRPGQSWQVIGSACFAPGGPISRSAFEYTLNEQVERAEPPLRPSHRPRSGVVTQLPVVFDSGQGDADRAWTWTIVGMPVRVQAQPVWSWQFVSGGPVVTATHAGGAGSSDTVQHTYRTHGIHPVRVQATWSATYEVGGLGPLAVTQPVRQTQEFDLPVGQARAVLIR